MDGATAAKYTVPKTLLLDLVVLFKTAGIDPARIPAKIEGLAFGSDLNYNGTLFHTLWIANDNDFLNTVADPDGNSIPNPNQFFVVGFRNSDLGGSKFIPQPVRGPWF